MSDMPERVRLDPDYDGFGEQVVGWNAESVVSDNDWVEYIRLDVHEAAVRRAYEDAATVADPPLMHRKGRVGLWRKRRAAIAESIRARAADTEHVKRITRGDQA